MNDTPPEVSSSGVDTTGGERGGPDYEPAPAPRTPPPAAAEPPPRPMPEDAAGPAVEPLLASERDTAALGTITRVVVLLAAVVVAVCVVFIAVQQRRQTSLLRRQGCLQQTAYIRALEPSTESAQQLLEQQTAQVRACVGVKP